MAEQHRDRAQDLLQQQITLARFGEFALKSEELDEILTEACRLVGEVLGSELAKVMELSPDGTELLVRAGVGWRPGVVGRAKLQTGRLSAAGHALLTGAPVISNHLAKEERFDLPGFLKEHGVQAMVNVIILGADGKPPYGILEVDSPSPRAFSDDDAAFLRGYANLLAAAVHRFGVVRELRTRADEKERLLHELQHRVKNNLQVITSLVNVQARRAKHPDAQRELRVIGDRIETLRLVHDRLHATGEVDRLDLGTYLGELAASLLRFHRGGATNIRLISDVGLVTVSPEVAVPDRNYCHRVHDQQPQIRLRWFRRVHWRSTGTDRVGTSAASPLGRWQGDPGQHGEWNGAAAHCGICTPVGRRCRLGK